MLAPLALSSSDRRTSSYGEMTIDGQIPVDHCQANTTSRRTVVRASGAGDTDAAAVRAGARAAPALAFYTRVVQLMPSTAFWRRDRCVSICRPIPYWSATICTPSVGEVTQMPGIPETPEPMATRSW